MRRTAPHHSRPLCRTLLASVVGLLLGLGLLTSSASVAHAQEPPAADVPRTWTIKPATPEGPDARAYLEYDVTPGQTITDTVAVTNFSDEPLQLRVYASDAFTPADGGFDLLAQGQAPVDVGAWVELGAATIDVAPQQTVLVPVEMTIPGNATPGDHAGGIVASLTTTATDANGQQVAVENRVGTRVYVRVAGTLTPRLDVIDLSSTYDGTLNPAGGGSIDATYKVVNSGNLRLSGTQTVTVTGLFGVELGSVRLDDLPEMLPGASLDMAARLDGIWPAGRLTTEVELQALDANASIELDPTSTSTSSWAVPWSQLVVLLVLVGLAILVVRRLRRPPATAAPAAAPAAPGSADGASPDPEPVPARP